MDDAEGTLDVFKPFLESTALKKVRVAVAGPPATVLELLRGRMYRRVQ